MKRRLGVLVALILGTIGTIGIAGCRGDDPRAQVLATIGAAESAIEDGELTDLFDLISEHYADERGRDKAALTGQVAIYLKGQGKVYLLTRVREPEFTSPDLAEVGVRVAAAASPIFDAGVLESIDADLFHVDVTLAREGSNWRIVNVSRASLSLFEFLAD